MRFLKTNTATRVTVGPFIDKTDGFTPEVSLTVTSEKLTLVVDDGGVPTLVLDTNPTASAGNNDMVHITGDEAGYYDLELAAANVNYVGRACLSLNDVATHLPVFHEFMILSAQAYEGMCGTGNFSADAKAINAVATTSVTTVSAYQGTTQPVNFTGTGATAYAKSDLTMIATAAVNTATAQIGANVVTQANIDFGALQKASLNAATPASVVGAVGSIASGGIAAASIATGAITNAKFAAGAIDAAAIANGAIDNATFAADVGSTAYATNIIALAADKAVVNAALGTAAELAKVPKSDSTVTFNATALASIKTQATAALSDIKLDHLVAVADADDAVDNSIIAKLASKGATADWSTFVNTTDSLEANRDNIGTTGAGLTTMPAIPTVTAIAAGGINNASFAADVGSTAYATNIIALAADKAIVNAALGTAAELAKVPKSDSNVTWNATALASINAEVDGALNTAIPGSPTADSINERVVAIDAYGAPPSAATIGTDAASKVLVTPAQKLVTDANGYVTYSNAAPPSAASVAALVLVTPAQKLVTDANGYVTASSVTGAVGSVAAGGINNASFNADVGSTAFATNIIALSVFKALDSAITDAVSLTTGGLLEKVRRLAWIIGNKIEVTDANGNTVIYKDDSTTAAYTVNTMLTDNSTTTTRLRAA